MPALQNTVVSTTSPQTNGILGGWVTYNSDSWATQGMFFGIGGLTNYGVNVYSPGTNTDVTTGSGIPSSFTTNSLRMNGSVSAVFSGTNTIQSGGILVRNGSAATISGGTLTSPTGQLTVHAYGSLAIDSSFNLSGGLVKTGFNVLILTGDTSGFNGGPLIVNEGFVRLASLPAMNNLADVRLSSPTGGAGLSFLLPNGQDGTLPATIRLGSSVDTGNDFFNLGQASRITLGGTIFSAVGTTPLTLIGSAPDSGFNLTGVNTFTGDVTVSAAILGIAADANLGNASNTVIMPSMAFPATLEFLTDGTGLAHSLRLDGAAQVTASGANNNSIDSAITGVGSLTKLGAGTLTLNNAGNSYSGGTFVNEGRLMLSAGTAILAGTDVTVAAGAEFNTGGQSNTSATAIGSLVLNSGTLRTSSGSGDYYVNQLQMTSGAVDFSGSTAFGLHVVNPAGITVNAGASSWVGGGTSSIFNDTAGPLPITVNPGGTLTAGIILSNAGANPEFIFTGGGAVRFTNTGNTANITVGTTLYTNDLSTNVGSGASARSALGSSR